jgi:histidinol-phosphatase
MTNVHLNDLDKAILLADSADAITTQYYLSSSLTVTDKPDDTPVTQADLAVEKELSRIVHETFHDAYVGEEGVRDTTGGRRWVVDPIDGTKNFMRGMPVWATLIGLSDAQGPLVTIVSAPALGRRWWASKGNGSWTRDPNGKIRQLHTSGVEDLHHAFLLHSSLFSWDTTTAGTDAVFRLLQQSWRHRGIGDFFGHMLVAEGAADACFEPNLKLWDLEALRLIVTEAGGSIWTNAISTTPPEASRIVITTNGRLEQLLVSTLGK